jgi:HprK-related kinase A
LIDFLEYCRLIRGKGFTFTIGPFNISIKSREQTVISAVYKLYSPFNCVCSDEYIDFHIELRCPSVLRRVFRPQIEFVLDGIVPFKPLPRSEAFPLFEWGLNWCIATRAHQNFMLHSAVLEKNGMGVILPAPPGSGKSTLCAALAFSGWRLLSDEFALLSHDVETLTPLVRPVSLKNQSIDLIKTRYPNVEVGSFVKNTSKGDVAHIRPLKPWFDANNVPAAPKWIVFPKYIKGSSTIIEPIVKSKGMLQLISNSFNYSELGEQGFQSATKLAQCCDFYALTYSELDEALAFFNELASQ